MKKLLLLFALTGVAPWLWGQSRVEVRPVPYDNIIHLHIEHAPQGFAVYGRWAFMLRHGGQLVPVDMKEHLVCFSCHLPGNTTHCNNASWGRRSLGRMPLLYVSDCYGDKYCRVYELAMTQYGHSFGVSSVEVQRIFFETNSPSYAMDWIVDARHRRLYAYGGQKGEVLWLKEFMLPNVSDTLVRLGDEDVLRTIIIRGITVPQGSMVHRGRIYLLDGDDPEALWLRVYDLKNGDEVGVLDLKEVGLEPEGISQKGRWTYVSFNGKGGNDKIFKIKLPRR